MEFAACVVPATAVRKKPSHKSEMINQLLFGETMEILKTKKEQWLKIRGTIDKYEGYVRANVIEPIEAIEAQDYNAWVAGDLINVLQVGEQKMNVSVGSSLLGLLEGEGKIGKMEYHFWESCYRRNDVRPQPELIEQLTKPWLNSPYLWGGRTPMGVDCSGFVQIVFKMMGIDLWRDAYLQAEQGIKINKLEDVQCGDLAFFTDSKGRIMHVGILLNENEIIHASGKVRIDTIDGEGISNTSTGNRTHKLKTIRRYW
jgi:gamma-D-glutamyl-L-lysine dipeptidyl-peptidase